MFVDTHVFVYHRDARDPHKQRHAAEWLARLWHSGSGRVSLQVLHEYYVTVTAKLDPGLPVEDARDDVQALLSWKPPRAGPELTEAAWREQDRWGFSFWDSLIVAAARAQSCAFLLTEDLSDGQDLGGVLVVSPFERAPERVLGA